MPILIIFMNFFFGIDVRRLIFIINSIYKDVVD